MRIKHQVILFLVILAAWAIILEMVMPFFSLTDLIVQTVGFVIETPVMVVAVFFVGVILWLTDRFEAQSDRRP